MEVDRLELDTVRELVDAAGKRVLEIGCGDGRFTFLYAHDAAYVLGVDPQRAENPRRAPLAAGGAGEARSVPRGEDDQPAAAAVRHRALLLVVVMN